MNDSETQDLVRVILAQVDAQSGFPPYDLFDEIERIHSRLFSSKSTRQDILDILFDVSAANLTRPRLSARLDQWDTAAEDWFDGAEAKTIERRHRVYKKLGVEEVLFSKFDQVYPIGEAKGPIIIAGDKSWDSWYTPERKSSQQFYQQAYRRALIEKGWDPTVVDTIDSTTDKVVGLLADPQSTTSYQAKGLVVGHVQSGKTANFTSVIAKCIDSGYKLIIVLTGTIELLRSQTQRRLDMELVGKENILPATDQPSRAALEQSEYYAQNDEDWPDFLSHAVNPYTEPDVPAVRRLTTYLADYEELGNTRNSVLDPRLNGELKKADEAMYSEANVQGVNVRLAVMKKNKIVLERLLADLSRVSRLEELSVLILDDEADQASVNTLNPKTSPKDDRTAINDAIVGLLQLLPRAQYLAYTATPYANVLIDAESPEQLFPKDFIISLEPPSEYMGGAAFHDLHLADEDQKTLGNSNELSHVRKVDVSDAAASKDARQAALDSFVLTGAIKLYRESRGAKPYKHHTMLVHESVKQQEHENTMLDLKKRWKASRYSEPAGLARLRALWEIDFLPTSKAKPSEASYMPAQFDELIDFIGRSVDKISSGHPVIVVNGDKGSDYEQSELDFQGGSVWKILVGGAKLSRGFTVEGLTISYYMRKSVSADTLMQAGRWFGFRPGYRDLVRLFIAYNVLDRTGRPFDLYEAFTAITSDEDLFRRELRDFSELDEEGRPLIRPIDVRPLVFQELPWLRPAAANKMHHARLSTRGKGGVLTDFMRHPDRADGHINRRHFDAFLPILRRVDSRTRTFYYSDLKEPVVEKIGESKFEAYVAVVPAEDVLVALKSFEWADGWDFTPDLDFLEKRIGGTKPTITHFAVILPKLDGCVDLAYPGVPVRIPIIKRKRRNVDPNSVSARPGFSGSSFRQRQPIEHIAGGRFQTGGPDAEKLKGTTTAALLLTYAADQVGGSDPLSLSDPLDPLDVATLFAYAPPKASAPRGQIGFTSGTA
ncbi:MAG: Z1 domain-containing protein [Rhodococcus sp. (in: high G+C Gram-positive bacteria)]